MRKIWNNLSENRGYFVLTLFVGIVYTGISVLSPTISGDMISAFVRDTGAGKQYLFLYLLAGLGQIAFSVLDASMDMRFRLRQKQTMRKKVFKQFSQRDSVGREEIASFVSYVNNDIPAMVEQFFSGTIDIVKCVCTLVFSAVSMLYVHWSLALIVFASSGLILLYPRNMRQKGAKARADYSASLGKYNINLQSFLGGLRIIKSYGYHERANQIQEDANKQVATKERSLIRCQLNVQGMTGFLQVGKTVLILTVGVGLIASRKMEIGGLLAVVQLAQLIAAPAEVLAYMMHARNEVFPLLEQYEKMMENDTSNMVGFLLSGSVESIALDHVSYEVDGVQILRNVTAAFEAGKNYLISGESGSGKSTLMRLVSQIGDLNYTGRIVCNGKNMKELDRAAYYRKVCPVFQEPYLFHATLEENILLGRKVAASDYHDIIRNLNLEYLIERFQGQEITPEIMERISGGERQRVVLARAMVGKPEVYLLDEVTSALDQANSEKIEELLLREDAMVIHICHKANLGLSSLYHRTLRMEDGRLV